MLTCPGFLSGAKVLSCELEYKPEARFIAGLMSAGS